jgi:NTE family protein
MPARKTPRKSINLALQGGGSHGAFTWGVLDRLFEDGRLRVAAVSGASAGAMNAVVAAQGMQQGGPEGARAALTRFWTALGDSGARSLIRPAPWSPPGDFSLNDSPSYIAFDLLSRLASPYDLNPFGLNPLRDLLAGQVDFDRVRDCAEMEVLISATNVETGHGRVFRRGEITLDVVMASACLPFLFQAVRVGDGWFWDGGYMGNPPLTPFFDHSDSDDIVIVQINPVFRPGAPRRAHDILNRLNEITFNSALLHELRGIDTINRLLAKGTLTDPKYRPKHIHMIEARKRMRPLDASSKLNADPRFLKRLFEIGRAAADTWLGRCYDALGERCTVDMSGMIAGPVR